MGRNPGRIRVRPKQTRRFENAVGKLAKQRGKSPEKLRREMLPAFKSTDARGREHMIREVNRSRMNERELLSRTQRGFEDVGAEGKSFADFSRAWKARNVGPGGVVKPYVP